MHNDLQHMRDSVFFDGPDVKQKLSRFWILLILAAIIATAGVIADSTATVIGAMIVAPLMIPIQGTSLAVVLADKGNLGRSIAMVAAGAAAVVAVSYVIATMVVNDVVAATNGQVAVRVNPRLIDLLAALATGVVGAVALVRSDISDTLPGVAIAISLVPPLAVVGVTLEAGEVGQAGGALLLFMTNVAAILVTGTIVMAGFRVHRFARDESRRRGAILGIAALVIVIALPLIASTASIARSTAREVGVTNAAQTWGTAVGWDVIQVITGDDVVVLRMEGPLPFPDTDPLRDALVDEGVDPSEVQLDMLPSFTVDLG